MSNVINQELERLKVKKKHSAVALADEILTDRKIIYCLEDFYLYEDGRYKLTEKDQLRHWTKLMLNSQFTTTTSNEIISNISAQGFIPQEKLDDTKYLNLKNGFFNLDTYETIPHTPNIYSTIQLDASYNPEAKCEKWVKALNEMLEEDQGKINLLQEFFGLCLTRDTKYDKALFLLGEGSNGKSVALYILEKLLGGDNTSAIPLEKFGDGHYTAQLFGKLANISIETKVKTSVYDSVFKSMTSGDLMSADRKYRKVFKFRPFCKLLFALNTMPRVDDKTDAFFRRLLILKFNKQFKEEEQNKNLKYQLEEELDGIFNWSLLGLDRLRQRGYFLLTSEIEKEILLYREENNNLLLFVKDVCAIEDNLWLTKDEIYEKYKRWCEDGNCRPLSKNKFGRELPKHFPTVKDKRGARGRYWDGIGWA